MTGPDTAGTYVHVAGQRWKVAPDDDHELVERLTSAADQAQVFTVRVLDEHGADGVLVVAPAVVPVVVTGARRRPPSQGRPQY